MFNRSKTVTSILFAGLYAAASPAIAASVTESGVEHEVNACVAEVREHLDYTDAARVRHDVTAIERRTVGYTLQIQTQLYDVRDEQAIREYAAVCVVNGDNTPLRFDIHQRR